MPKTIISDTSCLILLEKIDELDLLRALFRNITTTREVAIEFGHTLPAWCEIQQPTDKKYQSILSTFVDNGEASAIALAVECGDCLLIIDDLKGRKLAHQLGLTITGTLGIIVDAKRSGIIPSVKPIIAKIKQTNFRFSEQVEALILNLAGE